MSKAQRTAASAVGIKSRRTDGGAGGELGLPAERGALLLTKVDELVGGGATLENLKEVRSLEEELC